MSTAFSISLTGSQQVPGVVTTASGFGAAMYDSVNHTLTYVMRVTGLDFGNFMGVTPQTPGTADDVTDAHFHVGARGVNGGVVLGWKTQDADDFSASLQADGSWLVLGTWELTDPASTSLSFFEAGLAATGIGQDMSLYANIHTVANGGGELRGQLVGQATDNGETITGTSGGDIIFDLAGNDVVNAGNGNDMMIASAGDDVYDGGAGTDTVTYSLGSGPVAVYLYDVRDFGGSIGFAAFASGTGIGTDYLKSIEDIDGSSGADYLYGDFQANEIDGAGGNDLIRGLQGNDVLNGEEARDLVLGDEGNDTLIGEDGGDIMDGGADNDNLQGGAGDDELYGGNGTDTLDGGSDNDILYTDGLDTIIGGSGTDYLVWNLVTAANLTITNAMSIEWATGRNDHDTIDAAGITNFIEMQGQFGADILTAGNGGSILLGGGGNDRLVGGSGVDHFVGGDDGDTIVINVNGGTDYVYDFLKVTDKVDMTALAAAGIHGFGDLTANTAYSAAGWYGYGYGSGTIWVNTGSDNNALTNTDFLFA